jgi:hypothetical protein
MAAPSSLLSLPSDLLLTLSFLDGAGAPGLSAFLALDPPPPAPVPKKRKGTTYTEEEKQRIRTQEPQRWKRMQANLEVGLGHARAG